MNIPVPKDTATVATSYSAAMGSALVSLNAALGLPPGSGSRATEAHLAAALLAYAAELRANGATASAPVAATIRIGQANGLLGFLGL